MWADTLLALERTHLLRLMIWGGSSVLLGTLVLTVVAARRARSGLLTHFAAQTVVWGALGLVAGVLAWRALALRDLDAATALVNRLWLSVGLAAGAAGIGCTLALCSWRFGRRAGGIGAGIGLLVQGLAFTLLALMLLAEIAAARAA